MTSEGGVSKNRSNVGKVDRQPTKWVNFISNSKYKGEETPYRMFVDAPIAFEGVVEFVGEGETKVGKRTFPSRILILQSNGTKYGFNLPIGSYLYTYITDGRKVNVGDKVRVIYLGLAKDFNIAKAANVYNMSHLIKVELVEEKANNSN